MNINQLSRTAFLSRTHRILTNRYLNRSESTLLKFSTVTLLFVLFPPLSMPNSTISCLLQLRLPPAFTFPSSSSLFASMSSRACTHVGCSITCVRKLLSMHSRSLLDCLCPAMFISPHTLCLPNSPPLPHLIVNHLSFPCQS